MIAIFALVRGVQLASLMAVFGAGAYLVLLRRQAATEIPLSGLGAFFTTAATLGLITAIAGLGFVAGQMSGDWRSAFDTGALATVITDTRFGHVFLARVIGLTILLLIWILGRPPRILISTALAALLLGALALTSHAAASGAPGASDLARAGNDMVHLLAGGFWLGGLVVLSTLMWRHGNAPTNLVEPVHIFSVWGTYVVVILVLSGVVNAASILPVATLSRPISAYVALLIAKVGVASVMIVLAAVNRWRFAPALYGGEVRARQFLALGIGVEIVLGFAVVCIAGYLGHMPPR